jgi:CRISPR system Cascade subunit CasA
MKFSFDLVHEPWIPCIDLQGRQQSLGLETVLVKAHELQCIQGATPPVTGAVLFVLLAILHKNFDQKNEQAWLDLWQKGKFDVAPIMVYFTKWKDRFNLFHHERPFYQSYTETKPKAIKSLQMHMASGKIETLFDHAVEGKVALQPADAALALITMQLFGLAGLCDPNRGLVDKDVPCARGVMSFLSGNTLFETLMLNLPVDITGYPFEQTEKDQPAWEADNVYTPARTVPLEYLDFLTWQSRRILLIPENEDGKTVVRQMTTAPGLVFDAETQNPFYCYRVQENKEKKFLHFGENKGFWRDSAVLLSFEAEEIIVPFAFQWFYKLSKNRGLDRDKITITALGMSTEPGKHKIRFYRFERLVLSAVLVSDPILCSALQIGIGYAEYANRVLWAALTKMADMKLSSAAFQEDTLLTAASKKAKDIAKNWGSQDYFLKNLEKHFYLFLEDLPQSKTIAFTNWNKAVYTLAWQALKHAEKMSGGKGAVVCSRY